MIWHEDELRERVRVGVGGARGDAQRLTFEEVERLFQEIDRLRTLARLMVRDIGSESNARDFERFITPLNVEERIVYLRAVKDAFK